MIRWYHAITSAYGFWLPNDPRGSWSDFVHAYDLFRAGGPATTVSGKRSYAHDRHDAAFRRAVKEHLKYPPVRFDEPQRQAIARGIGWACEESGIVVHACAIGFDHVHLVTARHATKSIESICQQFKSFATKRMNAEGSHPQASYAPPGKPAPTPWAVGEWSVFIDDLVQLQNAIAYVERHPMKEGLARQDWTFVRRPDALHG